jgi:hypothetical protein
MNKGESARPTEQAELINVLFDDLHVRVGPYPKSSDYLFGVSSILRAWPHLINMTIQRKRNRKKKSKAEDDLFPPKKTARQYYLEKIRQRFRLFRKDDPMVSQDSLTQEMNEKYTSKKIKARRNVNRSLTASMSNIDLNNNNQQLTSN